MGIVYGNNFIVYDDEDDDDDEWIKYFLSEGVVKIKLGVENIDNS